MLRGIYFFYTRFFPALCYQPLLSDHQQEVIQSRAIDLVLERVGLLAGRQTTGPYPEATVHDQFPGRAIDQLTVTSQLNDQEVIQLIFAFLDSHIELMYGDFENKQHKDNKLEK